MPLVGGEPRGYRGNLEQTVHADAQLRGEAPCTDVTATALARTMATDLCAASLKDAGKMRARVRELEHELQWTQTKLLHAHKYAYEQQSNSASAPNEDRGSPLAAAAADWSRHRNSQWTLRFVQQKR
jgi:hypothetical protein